MVRRILEIGGRRRHKGQETVDHIQKRVVTSEPDPKFSDVKGPENRATRSGEGKRSTKKNKGGKGGQKSKGSKREIVGAKKINTIRKGNREAETRGESKNSQGGKRKSTHFQRKHN